VPEPEEWQRARGHVAARAPRIMDLFRGSVRATTLKVTVICAVSVDGPLDVMYWHQAHVRSLPEVQGLSDAARNHVAVIA